MITKRIIWGLTMILLSAQSPAQKVGLVLSGGGVRGMAHIGVIKALEESGIPIDCISGTSAGALVGAMYASGRSPDEMESIVMSNEFREWATGTINEELDYYYNKDEPNAGWVSLKFSVDSVIRTYIPTSVVSSAITDYALTERMSAAIAAANYDFDSLFVPYRCVASDIQSHQQVIFDSGDLPLAVRSSMAYPLYFSPITLNDMILYDGGIYNNFPVDVMEESFDPELIIGVNAGGFPDVAYEDNIFSIFRSMVMQTTVYSMPGPDDVLLTPLVTDINVFDFNEIQAAIDSGYYHTIRNIEKIRSRLSTSRPAEEVTAKRTEFKSRMVPVEIDQISASGVNPNQESYIKRILNPDNDCLTPEQLKKEYFKLVTDRNIRSLFPRLTYNPQTGFYDMNLLVKKQKDLKIDFGGNISSSPINQAFVGAQYNIWGKNALAIDGNIYFGKLYNSGKFSLRHNVPTKLPFFFEPYVTLNRFDYFKSSSAFLEDIKPPYLVINDRIYGLRFGIPARNKGVVTLSGGAFNNVSQYYQVREFSNEDTPDETELIGGTIAIHYERNTQNQRMYADKGTFFSLTTRYVNGTEKTTPGTTDLLPDTVKEDHNWLHLRVLYDNYFKSIGPVKLGFYTEMFLSSQPFFANYTGTILAAKGFEPIPQSQTLFLEAYHSHNYTGMGLKLLSKIKGNVEARIEGYIYQPFQVIVQKENQEPKYGEAFVNRYYMATLATVYKSPFGPLSLSVNYYSEKDDPFTVLLHFGFIIFNKRALY